MTPSPRRRPSRRFPCAFGPDAHTLDSCSAGGRPRRGWRGLLDALGPPHRVRRGGSPRVRGRRSREGTAGLRRRRLRLVPRDARPGRSPAAGRRNGAGDRPFGTLYAPNISPDPVDGIGTWRAADLANALLAGVSPLGQHYYPVFPYTSFAHMERSDVRDLMAYLRTLPPVRGQAATARYSPFLSASGGWSACGSCSTSTACRSLPIRRTTARGIAGATWSKVRRTAPNAIRRATSPGPSRKTRGSPAAAIRKAPASFPTSRPRRSAPGRRGHRARADGPAHARRT